MKKVLLVDDDPITNLINKKNLERTGLFSEINSVLNGKQALQFLQGHEYNPESFPDIIILDLNMPVMGGFAFLNEFRKLKIINEKKIKVIIVSTSDNAQDIKMAKDFGIENYLTKPVSGKELIEVLE